MDDVTQLLLRWREGSREAENELFALVNPNLRRLAHHLMRGERQGHTLQATELVDDVYFALVRAKDRDWRNRAHFFAIAARAMRRHLIDHARSRGDAQFVPLEGMSNFLPVNNVDVEFTLMVDGLLDRLEEFNPEWCRLAEVKCFLGLTDEEAAEVLGIKLRSMQRMWLDTRQWLYEQSELQKNSKHNEKSAGR